MLNHFLADLDGVALAPTGVVWPSWQPRQPSIEEQTWRSMVYGNIRSREQRYRVSLMLYGCVAATPLKDLIVAKDTRVTVDPRDMSRLYAATTTTYSGSTSPTPQATVSVTADTPDYAQWKLTMISATQVNILDAGGNAVTQTVTFTAGLSSAVPDFDATSSFRVGSNITGDSWVLTYWAGHQRRLGKLMSQAWPETPPSFMGPRARALWASPVAIERVAAIITSLTDAER